LLANPSPIRLGRQRLEWANQPVASFQITSGAMRS
jgi:hypothetical protein